ncbi:cilia- and flagella-associated protein 58 isoform X2 [Drosophila miranda]|uniref:cilia- and flagella-associated protein 58 isoform X2 n=1 Tax=Drosophila miranda TaxID=7229 RepID=UPI00143F6D18|nr:cilia- and flagella-associated protein 58 isoform X2 [Drosophila miranda]
MIPKKDKKKINKPKETDIEEPLIFKEIMDEADVLELNLFTDINEAFFNEANRVVQVLMEAKRNFEASRIKRYTDIIFNLHRLYVDEVIDNDFLRPRIVSSENKLRLALELTLTSEEAVQKLKEALGDAWKESDSSALREQLVQEKLQEVLIKCDGLGDINSGLTDDAAENNINSLEKDVLNANGRTDDIRRIKETLQRERDSLRSDIIKLSNTMADFKHDMMLKANMISSLNLDINKLNVKLDEAYILKSKAEKERDEMAQEMETLHERIENYQDQISLKTSQVNDLTEKLHEKQREVHNFKKQLESVHSEKMMLHRNLENTTQERDNFRILQAKSGHQIQQLTTEISANEVKINSLNLKIEHLNNHIKELQSELKNKENLVTGLRKDMREMKAKNEMLSKTISNDELKFMKMGHELEEMRKERNLVGLQMVRRNDEIVVIKEKLQIAQNALDNGTTQYNQRVEDIRLLKKEISNLHTESVCLKHAIKSTADMRKEIVRLQRSLNQERIRIRALTEDAKTPTGVHRWRILKGEDPKKFQLLEKLQVLQKRALKQSIENSNIKNKFVEAQKTNETLKRMLSHMPTVEIKHKLVVQQRINRQMTKKLKTLSAERSLDMIEWNSRQFNYAGKLNGMEKFPLIPKPETNIAQPSEFEGPQKYLDCALFSDADTNTSLICEK